MNKTNKKHNLMTDKSKENYKREIEKIRKRITEKQIKTAKYYNENHRLPNLYDR